MKFDDFCFELIIGNMKATCNYCGKYGKVIYVGHHPHYDKVVLFVCSEHCLREFDTSLKEESNKMNLFLDLVLQEHFYMNN